MAETITVKELARLLKEFKKISNSSKVKSLNKLAEIARIDIIKQLPRKFKYIRNTYTADSMEIIKAHRNNLSSVVGSISPYMQYHEDDSILNHNVYSSNSPNNPSATLAGRGGNKSGIIDPANRFGRSGGLGRMKPVGGNNDNYRGSTSFIIKVHGKEIVYRRLASGKGNIVALRVLEKSTPIRGKKFFQEASQKAINSNKAFKVYSFSLKTSLDRFR